MQNSKIIQTKNLSRVFIVGGREIKAVDNADLEINKGDFVAIMGPSGSGKTTLLNLLGTLDQPTSGVIYFQKKDVARLSEKQRENLRLSSIGFIFQTFNLLPTVKAWENIALPGLLRKMPAEQRIKRAAELLARMGLSERGNHYPSQLSAGEQQRVAIARALFNQPRILLADEPTGNLDIKSKREIADLLEKINSEYNTAVLLVTHDSDIASRAQRVIKMKDGKMEI